MLLLYQLYCVRTASATAVSVCPSLRPNGELLNVVRTSSYGFQWHGKWVWTRNCIEEELRIVMIVSFFFLSFVLYPPTGRGTREGGQCRWAFPEGTSPFIIEKINQFTDIRMNPQIKLNHIVLSVVLMPFYSVTSLLGLDRLSRKQSFKQLYGCTRKMVALDSAVNRALRWLDSKEVEQFQSSFLPFAGTTTAVQDPAGPDQKSRDSGWLSNGSASCGGLRSLCTTRLSADGQQFPQ